jgi:hypothetical protein
MPPLSHPMFLTFDAKVSVSVLSGFLPAAGTLLCDPVAKIVEVTRRTFSNHRAAAAGEAAGAHTNAVYVDHEERVIGTTKQRIFTAHPNFDETIKFVCPSLDRRDGTARRAAQIAAAGGGGVAPDDAHASSTLVSTERYLVITVEDSAGNFLGFAKCEFPLDRPSTGSERLMLVPRYLDEHDHPSRIEDIKTLDRFGIDDFGFLNIEWAVAMIPVGGAVLSGAAEALRSPLPPPPLPVGLVVKASWIPSSAAGNSVIDRSPSGDPNRRSNSHMSFQMFVSFDNAAADTDQLSATTFRLEHNTPLFVGLSKVELLETATFLCRVQKGQHGGTVTSKLVLPIQPFFPEAIERDVSYCAPLYASGVYEQQGILIVSIRALAKPIEGPLPVCRDSQQAMQGSCPRVNDPRHQAQVAHPNQLDWGRPMPNCPLGAYQPVVWESESHIARSTERRWKQECVLHSRPTNEHVRHIFEALLGRVALDMNIAQLASSFFNKAANTLTTTDLQQLLAAVVFHAEGLSLQDAIRFGFVMMRRESERAIKISDVVLVLENSLFGRTVDMPFAEIERRVTDILGVGQPDRFVTFDEYNAFIAQHAALWFDLGASLMFAVTSDRWEQTTALQDNGNSFTSGQQRPQQQQSVLAANLGGTAVATTSATATALNASATIVGSSAATKSSGPPTGGENPEHWRTFTVRVIKTGRAFSVTSHINDSIVDVMQMVEESSTIPATRQKWIFHGLQVDTRRKVGDVFPHNSTVAGKQPEVSVQEKEEMLKLVVVFREKNKKWEQEFLATEKVLRLRAFAQHKTMIPLSRCAMSSCGVVMQDRHCLDHYKLVDGSIIEITQQ